MDPDKWQTYETVLDLGWPTFAPGAWWKFTLSAVLFIIAIAAVVRIILLKHKTGNNLFGRALSAGIAGVALAAIVPIMMTVDQTTPEHRRGVMKETLTKESGYTFAFDRPFPSDSPFSNKPILMRQGRFIYTCSLSMWRKQRWSGAWVTELSKYPWNNTSTVKIQLTCPRNQPA